MVYSFVSWSRLKSYPTGSTYTTRDNKVISKTYPLVVSRTGWSRWDILLVPVVLVNGSGSGKTHERFFYPSNQATPTGLTHVTHSVLPGSAYGLFKLGSTWTDSSTSFLKSHQRLLTSLVTSKIAVTLKICFVTSCLVSQINFLLTGSFRSFQTLSYTTHTTVVDL